MSGGEREGGYWHWDAPNKRRWVSTAPELTEEEKRSELAALATTLPAEWLDDIIRAAKHGPEVFDPSYAHDLPRDPVEDDVFEAYNALYAWADLSLNAMPPDYTLHIRPISLSQWGFFRDVPLSELAELGGFDADALTAAAAERAREGHEHASQDGPSYDLHDLNSQLTDAAVKVLRQSGVLRGPCPRCNRPEWLTKFRPPRSPGRTPLDHTYCPDCVDAIKREQKAESMRRARMAGRQ